MVKRISKKRREALYSKYIENVGRGDAFKKSAYTELTGDEMEQIKEGFDRDYRELGSRVVHDFHSITALMDRISKLEERIAKL